jgi:hypothetical protein
MVVVFKNGGVNNHDVGRMVGKWLRERALMLCLYVIVCLIIYVALQTSLAQGLTFFGFVYDVLLTFGRTPCPWMGDRPVVRPPPTQDNTNTNETQILGLEATNCTAGSADSTRFGLRGCCEWRRSVCLRQFIILSDYWREYSKFTFFPSHRRKHSHAGSVPRPWLTDLT